MPILARTITVKSPGFVLVGEPSIDRLSQPVQFMFSYEFGEVLGCLFRNWDC